MRVRVEVRVRVRIRVCVRVRVEITADRSLFILLSQSVGLFPLIRMHTSDGEVQGSVAIECCAKFS